METRFAELISRILHPFYMPIYGLLILYNSAFSTIFSGYEKITSLLILFLFTILFPALIILRFRKKRKISDFNISNRKERFIPFLCVFCCYVLCAVVFIRFHLIPSFLSVFLLGSAVSILFLILISFFWKISAHLTGIGGLCGTIFGTCLWLNINTLNLFVLCVLLAGVLAYARITLQQHSLAQTISGFLLGFTCLFLSNLFFVWVK
jgi:hypothetical protein